MFSRLGEDFLAATLGEKGMPAAPTIFIPGEERFYSYVPEQGIFVRQREPVLLGRLSRLILDCARTCKGSSDTRNLEFRLRDSTRLNGILRKARGILAVPDDFFSQDLTEFIPCANGMLRLSDKVLLPFEPKYHRRNKLAVTYDPSAKCPLFLDKLMRPALDPDDLDLLQRATGLFLIGQNKAQAIVMLIGTAGGGKGTYVRVLVGIIGEANLVSLRPRLLDERFEQSRFLGKTLLYGADVHENFLDQKAASNLKSLTGGDPMTFELKNSNETPGVTSLFNALLTCNSRLTVHLQGDMEAWRRRLKMVPYEKAKPKEVIHDLDKQILSTEASGVLGWALDGLDKLRSDNYQLRLTSKQQAAADNLLLESDSHSQFVHEGLVRASEEYLTIADCYAAYVEYCAQRGWSAETRKKFGDLIGDAVTRAFGLTVRHDIEDTSGKLQRGWKGLQLRSRMHSTANSSSAESDQIYSDAADGVLQVTPETAPIAPLPTCPVQTVSKVLVEEEI